MNQIFSKMMGIVLSIMEIKYIAFSGIAQKQSRLKTSIIGSNLAEAR